MADAEKPNAPGAGASEYPKVDREAHRSKLSPSELDQIDAALKKIKDIVDGHNVEPLHINTFSKQFIDPHGGGGPGS